MDWDTFAKNKIRKKSYICAIVHKSLSNSNVALIPDLSPMARAVIEKSSVKHRSHIRGIKSSEFQFNIFNKKFKSCI